MVGETIDREGLEPLFRERAPQLWRALLLSTGSREVASDAVAEAFAQAIRRGTELRDPLAWIWKVAFRVAAGEMKVRSDLGALPRDLPYEMQDSLVDLVRGLETLTHHQRTAIVLADYAGYSHREIARILDSSTSAVGVHVHRARRRLREAIGDDDD